MRCRKKRRLFFLLLVAIGWLFLLADEGKYSPYSFLSSRVREVIGADLVTVPQVISAGGLTGAGQIIALNDSGLLDGRWDKLPPAIAGRVLALVNVSGGGTEDRIGHGTHMAGIIAGGEDGTEGEWQGIAPASRLYIQAITDRNGRIKPPPDLNELFFPPYQQGARIFVNGWGSEGNNYNSNAAAIDRFVVEHPDALVIWAAGNNGPAKGSITNEANSKNALVIGASVNPRPVLDDGAAADDIYYNSSRGPTGDGRLKPDLLAPGTNVISLASSLAGNGLKDKPEYAVMSGTSQAAAVTAGAAALLREYLQRETEYKTPSAALMKAILLASARLPAKLPVPDYPGVLDLSTALISLVEKTLLVEDNVVLTDEQEKEYRFTVKNTALPLRVVLSWNDPVPANGEPQLVNDLDLTVIDPSGNIVYGNALLNEDKPDHRNNVEKVFIEHPLPGTYRIIVRPYRLGNGERATGEGQCFALAYGQIVNSRVIVAPQTLEDNKGKVVVNGQFRSSGTITIREGWRIYRGPQHIYVYGGVWHAIGVVALPSTYGTIWRPLRAVAAEEGRLLPAGAPLTVNGEPFEGSVQVIPPGVELLAPYDPLTGLLASGQVAYRSREGIITRIEKNSTGDNWQLYLAGNDRPLTASLDVPVVYDDNLQVDDPVLAAYGTGLAPRLVWDGKDSPPVNIYASFILSPSTGRVETLTIKRYVFAGTVKEVIPAGSQIVFSDGSIWELFAGATILKNGRPATLLQLAPEDCVYAVVLPGTRTLLAVKAYEYLKTGQVVYLDRESRTVYLRHPISGIGVYHLAEAAEIWRWGLPTSLSTVNEGHYVRVWLDDRKQEILHLEVAELFTREVAVRYVNAGDGFLRFSDADGRIYYGGEKSQFFREAFPISAADLLPGEEIIATVFIGNQQFNYLILEGKAKNENDRVPELLCWLWPHDGYYLLVGTTTASRVYVWWDDGKKIEIIPNKSGGFYRQLNLPPYLLTVQVVAVDRQGGTATGRFLRVLRQENIPGFTDISDHWAEEEIKEAAGRGLIAGFPGSKFYPDGALSRAELAVLIMRAFFNSTAVPQLELSYRDAGEIPVWAVTAVKQMRAYGIMMGYPDGSFRPYQPATRLEMALILVRIAEKYFVNNFLHKGAKEGLPADCFSLRQEEKKAVAVVYNTGLMVGRAGGRFEPYSVLTRAEGITVLNRLWHMIQRTAGMPPAVL